MYPLVFKVEVEVEVKVDFWRLDLKSISNDRLFSTFWLFFRQMQPPFTVKIDQFFRENGPIFYQMEFHGSTDMT